MRRLSLVLPLLLVSLPSCASYGANARVISVPGYPSADIWREVTRFARTRGYAPNNEETDVGLKTYTSRWQGAAVAFRRGSRNRFWAQLVESERGWDVHYHVEIQRVGDHSKNMNPEEDDWEYAGQHRTREEEFFRFMQTAFPRMSTGAAAGSAAGPRRG